ncbi:hypothetical protein GMLC_36830 [Geomonas limicola]|uniref:Lipoprotein n=1 Tax=Geomonas limicola TaxID=2740186 RepID=A0A6V8NE60_9BACT|nr:hypothetical protein [Geomonas limicola]GFO70104.1 hypothetical protein GMLC_36830 [Geomonas limicola]
MGKLTIAREILFALLLTVALVGCQKQEAAKPAAPAGTASPGAGPVQSGPALAKTVQERILTYNRLLIEGYQAGNMTALQQVTTTALAEKAYYHMAAIAEGKKRMVSQLKKIDFRETDCGQQNKCRVVTREVWDFGYADLKTNEVSNQVKDYSYDVQYLLENRQGQWLITEITASGEERKELPSWDKMFHKEK